MVVLLGGDPGIGKSTLLLETADNLAASGPVLYVSGEESNSQIRLRADRLNVKGENLFLYTETSAEEAIERAKEVSAQMLIVDSIQTMESEAAESAAGSISQVRAATALFTRFAKETGTVVWIVGHVTKDGAIAGPRVLEHIVDTVLYFEGDRHEGLRLLRAVKNRFGSTNELGVFEMCETGMREVKDPAALFVSGRNVIGTAVTCVLEGSRPLVAELQTLASETAFAYPKRSGIGVGANKIGMLLAVLQSRAGVPSTAILSARSAWPRTTSAASAPTTTSGPPAPPAPAAPAPRSTTTRAPRSAAAAPTASPAATATGMWNTGIWCSPSSIKKRTGRIQTFRIPTSIQAWDWSGSPASCRTPARSLMWIRSGIFSGKWSGSAA
jgi:KaiC/GvpD/RAD55 family RecA-like ATPase